MLINQEVLDIISRPRFISHNAVKELLLEVQDKNEFFNNSEYSAYLDNKNKQMFIIGPGFKPIVRFAPLAVKYQKEYYDITLC